MTSARERRQVMAANVMGLGLFAISWPYIVLFAFAREPILSLAVLVTCCGYLSAPVLNRLGRHMLAKIAPCVSGITVCYVFASALGADMHIHVSMVMLTGWAFNLFDVRRNPRALLFFAVTPGVLYAFVEFGVLLPFEPVVVPGALGFFIGLASLCFSYLLLVWVLWIFYDKNLKNEDSLEVAVERLEVEVLARKGAECDAQVALSDARSAGAAKSRFLASMSHEFRTPLNCVLGTVQVLSASGLTAEQETLLRDVHTQGTLLLMLLDNVLDVAMMEKSAPRIHEEDFELSNLLRESLHLAQLQGRNAQIRWHHELDANLPERIVSDEHRLRQVLCHLLSNAEKFTPAGEVVLKASAEVRDGGGLLTIAVEDTGIGIAPELHASIFEPFTQADNGLDRARGGAGMGLALCRAIVTAMNGTISVQARVGGGSVFSVCLPYRRPTETTDSGRGVQGGATLPELPVPKPLKILVAEDNPVNVKLLLKLLEKLGLNAVTCENGQLALKLFKSGSWDLVFMDVQMPEMDGIAATRAIREFERAVGTTHTPVVAVSANVLPEHIESGRQAGFDMYMTKPVRLSELQRALATFVPLLYGQGSAETTS